MSPTATMILVGIIFYCIYNSILVIITASTILTGIIVLFFKKKQVPF